MPHLQDSLTTPVVSTEGRSILLTCVVRSLGNYTLLWKYGAQKVLTAGRSRVTADTRFSVLHDEGDSLQFLREIKWIHRVNYIFLCSLINSVDILLNVNNWK